SNAHVNAGIRFCLLGFIDHTNLAIAKTLLLIDEQSEAFGITIGSQSAIVGDESTPSHVNPACIDFAVGDQRQSLPPGRCFQFGATQTGEAGRGNNDNKKPADTPFEETVGINIHALRLIRYWRGVNTVNNGLRKPLARLTSAASNFLFLMSRFCATQV